MLQNSKVDRRLRLNGKQMEVPMALIVVLVSGCWVVAGKRPAHSNCVASLCALAYPQKASETS